MKNYNLNENEKAVLKEILFSAEDFNGGSWTLLSEVYKITSFTTNELKGYLSQLEQKEIIRTESSESGKDREILTSYNCGFEHLCELEDLF